MPDKDKPLALGWIQYWNLLPLKHELQKSFKNHLNLNQGVPSQVNKLLAEGKVNAAPCSSITLLTQPELEMAVPAGVASHGAVQSVYLGFRKNCEPTIELIRKRMREVGAVVKQARSVYGHHNSSQIAQAVWEECSSVEVDPTLVPALKLCSSSASSVMLSKILFHLWFGKEAERAIFLGHELSSVKSDTGFDHPMAELLIGDEALLRRSEFSVRLDFGEVWKQMTDLPFVFAVWQKNSMTNGFSSAHKAKVMECVELAQARMRVEPAVYMPQTETQLNFDLAHYWQGIDYRLTPSYLEGLCLYLSLARPLLIESDTTLRRILKFQELSAQATH